MSIKSFSPTLRLARPDDAPAISRLYHEAYRPANGGDPRQCYPFPQFLEPDLVETIIKNDTIRWFVAELEHEIIGTCGAVVNIGTQGDRVAECFGLVIDEKWRFQHIGTELFKRLHDSLTATEEAVFIIAETRTSHPGGWKVVRHCNFIPLGFEPYAHTTPAGSESMLLTGQILPAAIAKRKIDRKTSARVYQLSEAILRELNCGILSPQNSGTIYPLSPTVAASHLRSLEDPARFALPKPQDYYYNIALSKDEAAREPPERLKNVAPHKAGIISLQRLGGTDSKGTRYNRSHFLACLDNHPVAYALTEQDNLDHRLRILDLRTLCDGIQGLMIQHISEKIIHETAGSPLTAVVDVRADNVMLHDTLEKLGFFPTAYYPALIAEGDCRIDAVQFTRLYNLDLDKSRNCADFKEWPLATTVVSSISREYDE